MLSLASSSALAFAERESGALQAIPGRRQQKMP